ncbi:MAG: hypothetical protein GX071_00820 [Gammaproteobacteria bacterium]|nr:hypothetical protein [Gammaproteobacteria bacterium]
MKSQTDLIDRMARLMDSIENDTVSAEKAGAMIKAADVVVQVMKTEAAVYAASRGALMPTFTRLEAGLPHDPEEAEQERERQRIAAEKQERQRRLGRA